VAVISAALVTAATLGASTARWNDELTMSAVLNDARVEFGVGRAGEPLQYGSATDRSVELTFGAEEAQVLLDEGAVAVPIEVSSLSQGNRGLRYLVTPPTYGGSTIFAYATTAIFPVASPQECTVGASVPAEPSLAATPVPATYSASAVPTVEYWCLSAVAGPLPDEGLYSSAAEGTATAAGGGQVSASTSWYANVTTAMDPEVEPDHVISFTFETFR
jgi:hypothetical protein